MANKIFVSGKQSADGTIIGFWALIAIDNGDGTYSLFIKDQPTSGAPAIAAAISSSGASPVVASSGTGEVSGTGTTGKAVKWSNGPASVVSDADLAAIVASLGFTPEDVANKSTDIGLGESNVLYPAQRAVKHYVDQLLVTYAQSLANLTTDGTLGANSDTLYPSEKAVKTYVDDQVSGAVGGSGTPGTVPMFTGSDTIGDSNIAFNGLFLTMNYAQVIVNGDISAATFNGITPENVANKTTDGTLAANSDTLYPSEKAVKTYVDANAGATPQASWFLPNSNFFAGGAALGGIGVFDAADEVQVWGFECPFAVPFNHMIFEVVTPDLTGNVGIALYDATGARIATTGAVAATIGFHNINTSLILSPGNYYLGWTHDANTATLRGSGNIPNFNAFFNQQTVKVGRAANNGAGGVPPATLGAITSRTSYGMILCLLEA